MLDLTHVVRRLTQGQPAADMAVAAAPRPAESAEPATGRAPAPSTAAINPNVIAQRVYELMRRDLAVTHERRGRSR